MIPRRRCSRYRLSTHRLAPVSVHERIQTCTRENPDFVRRRAEYGADESCRVGEEQVAKPVEAYRAVSTCKGVLEVMAALGADCANMVGMIETWCRPKGRNVVPVLGRRNWCLLRTKGLNILVYLGHLTAIHAIHIGALLGILPNSKKQYSAVNANSHRSFISSPLKQYCCFEERSHRGISNYEINFHD
jgi:hypothetical protein